MLRGLQQSNQFTVLTANVAGLPGIISSSDPAKNTPELGKRISDFDIVNVQEDFNYHAELYKADKHAHRTPTSGGVPLGSGLNTLSNYKFTNVGGLHRIKWSKCSNAEGADCLTPKGFTYTQVELADGVFLDVYNVHTDAGDKTADHEARRANLNQLADYINTNSKDQAVVIFGDTNTRYTRAADNVREFVQKTGTTDAWVSFARKGNPPAAGAEALKCDNEKTTNDCEVVDKIFFRGNNLLKLNLVKFATESEKFKGPDGKQLSDHVPLSATFSWSVSGDIRQSAAVGGPHGTAFTDVGAVPVGGKVKTITVRGEKRVDAVSIEVGDKTFTHGGKGGTAKSLTLNADEVVTSAEIHWDKKDGNTRVFYVKFSTSAGRSVEVGTKSSDKVTYTAPTGWQISGFHGRAENEVDGLGVIYTKA